MNAHAQPLVAVSLAGLAPDVATPWSGDPKAMITWAASTGAGGVVIDVTRAGFRPRDLDQSARRDLGSTLRRRGLGFAGLDLWIPPEHFVDEANADRAFQALTGACELARALGGADAGSAIVSTALPEDAAIRAEASRIAEKAGAVVADHAPGPLGVATPPVGERGGRSTDPLRPGLDPATLMAAGMDVVATAARFGADLAVARLSDLGGMGRVEAGRGRLDIDAYRVTLEVAGYHGPLVVDLRGLREQDGAARAMVERLSGGLAM